MKEQQPWKENRIEGSLGRLFRPPSGVGRRLRGLIEGPTSNRLVSPAPSVELDLKTQPVSPGGANGSGSGTGLRLRPLLALAGAAALALIVMPRPHNEVAPTNDLLDAAISAQFSVGLVGLTEEESQALASAACPEDRFDWRRQTNPLPSAPDLASLYHEVIASAGEQAGQAGLSWDCASQTAGDSLLASLRDTCGNKLRFDSDASRFAGPFPFAEWRSGTVLAGFPEEGGLPSVLVADTENALRCCIDLVQPRDRSLRVFSWRVGDMLWIEITQRTQPRFLDHFELF